MDGWPSPSGRVSAAFGILFVTGVILSTWSDLRAETFSPGGASESQDCSCCVVVFEEGGFLHYYPNYCEFGLTCSTESCAGHLYWCNAASGCHSDKQPGLCIEHHGVPCENLTFLDYKEMLASLTVPVHNGIVSLPVGAAWPSQVLVVGVPGTGWVLLSACDGAVIATLYLDGTLLLAPELATILLPEPHSSD
jgi:hypothetical protein